MGIKGALRAGLKDKEHRMKKVGTACRDRPFRCFGDTGNGIV